MPHYFFHLKADPGTVVDEEGLVLNDINRARSGTPPRIVDEVLSERDFEQVDICGQSLEIADETGEIVVGFGEDLSCSARRATSDAQ